MNSAAPGGSIPETVRYNSDKLFWPIERYSGERYGGRTSGGACRRRDIDRSRDRDDQAADRRAYIDAGCAAAVDSRTCTNTEGLKVHDRRGIRAAGCRRHHPLRSEERRVGKELSS